MQFALIRYRCLLATASILMLVLGCSSAALATSDGQPPRTDSAHAPRLVYLVSDLRIPFWDIMQRGVALAASELGYQLTTYSAENNPRLELEFAAKALRERVDGIIISPTTSSACATILKLAERAHVPVVIADIGTDGGEYVSYISSNNDDGAYRIGKVLATEMLQRGWQDGSVGIVSIPQKRANGRARTNGFMRALAEAGLKGAGLRQQVDFSYDETYRFTRELIEQNPGLRAIWLQGSDRYQGALDAILATGNQGRILLLTFDAEPEFLELIPRGVLVGAAMQQPYLMGEKAVQAMHDHLLGRPVSKQQQLPVLAVSTSNIGDHLATIQRNVLGITQQD